MSLSPLKACELDVWVNKFKKLQFVIIPGKRAPVTELKACQMLGLFKREHSER